MASRTFDQNKSDADSSFKIRTTLADNDDETEMAGANRKTNREEEQEKMIKWQIPGHHSNADAKKVMLNLLASLLINHPNEITFIDRKQRAWSYDEADDESGFLKEFDTASIQVHAIKNKDKKTARWIAITKVISRSNPKDWKNNDPFYSTVTETKTYIFPHPFGQDEWDVVNVGFFKNIHVIHYPQEVLHEQIYNMLENQNKPIPAFQLIPQRISNIERTASTKAYSVQCRRDDATQMIHLLTHGAFRETPNQIFVPFKYKNTKPEIFLKCIRQQNEVYHKTWVIKMEGVTQQVMQYMEPEITKIMGVWHIVPSKRCEEIGEWKILTDQAKCSYIHRQLTEKWAQILSIIPAEILDESPDHFSLPMISSRRAREYQDSDSDADSYGSLLTTGTDVSAMTAEDTTYNELPNEYSYPSYAAAASASNTSAGDTQISSPTASTYFEWQKEKQELETLIRNQALQIEQIQADLEAKMSRSQDLEEKLAQAIELAHNRDVRHEEMLEKFEMLMKAQLTGIFPQNAITSQGNTNPSTPERQNQTVDTPPPKKANTNASPNRTIYALFRQQPGRHSRQSNSTRTSAQKRSSQLTITQPMEMDETIHQPSPGEDAGQMKE